MSHEHFDKAKQKNVARGLNPTAASILALVETGETDGSVSGSDVEIDTSNWTEEDFYNQNIKLGMDEYRARFHAASAIGAISLDDPTIDY